MPLLISYCTCHVSGQFNLWCLQALSWDVAFWEEGKIVNEVTLWLHLYYLVEPQGCNAVPYLFPNTWPNAAVLSFMRDFSLARSVSYNIMCYCFIYWEKWNSEVHVGYQAKMWPREQLNNSAGSALVRWFFCSLVGLICFFNLPADCLVSATSLSVSCCLVAAQPVSAFCYQCHWWTPLTWEKVAEPSAHCCSVGSSCCRFLCC